jgi:hypothetical protein
LEILLDIIGKKPVEDVFGAALSTGATLESRRLETNRCTTGMTQVALMAGGVGSPCCIIIDPVMFLK